MISLNQIITLCLCIFFLIPKLKAQKNKVDYFNISEISRKIDSSLQKYNKNEPGIAIGVVKDNNLVINKHIGLANLEHHIPITNKTSFHVASVSKQFTAFAILQLEDQNLISLEDDIRKYIPEMNEFEKKIKIRNLLNHTSGLKDQWNLLRLSGWRLNDFISNDQVLNILYNQTSLNFQPDDDYMYSNSGYTLLAEIVSRVANMSFSDYMKKNVFDPLNMDDTQFVDKEGQVLINKSASYYKKESFFIEDVFNNTSVGATNLSTTIEDLSKWAINFSEKRVGNKSIFQKMNIQDTLNNGELYGYANGQFINEYYGLKRIEHSGQDASYQAYFARFPSLNMSLIFTNNNSKIDGGKLIGDITNLCLDEYFKLNPKKNPNRISLSHKKPLNQNPKELESFKGFYWNEKDRYSRQIKIQNDTLQYLRNNKDSTALVPVSDKEFEMNIDEYVSVLFENNHMIVTLDDGYQIVLEKYIPSNYKLESLKEFKGTYYSPELKAYYTVNLKDKNLIAKHTRLGDFKLAPIKDDYFIGNKGSFQKVVFQRNKSGIIIGLEVSSSRAKNVRFNKILE